MSGRIKKALILAAGLGTRLLPLTSDRPKSLVPVNGKPILFQQAESLMQCGIEDITIVSGYQSDRLEGEVKRKWKDIHIVRNREYASTNNMYSAWLGMRDMFPEKIDCPFLMMNADVYFDASVIAALLEQNSGNAIIVDIGRYMEESMKVIERNGRIVEISKQIKAEDALGCSIDVYKFGIDGGQLFYDVCGKYVECGDLQRWSEVALNDVLKKRKAFFVSCPLLGRWMEIDNYEDLRTAEQIFSVGASEK